MTGSHLRTTIVPIWSETSCLIPAQSACSHPSEQHILFQAFVDYIYVCTLSPLREYPCLPTSMPLELLSALVRLPTQLCRHSAFIPFLYSYQIRGEYSTPRSTFELTYLYDGPGCLRNLKIVIQATKKPSRQAFIDAVAFLGLVRRADTGSYS